MAAALEGWDFTEAGPLRVDERLSLAPDMLSTEHSPGEGRFDRVMCVRYYMCPGRGQKPDAGTASWSDADLAFLISLLFEGKLLSEIAQAMERPPAEVIALAAEHGLKLSA